MLSSIFLEVPGVFCRFYKKEGTRLSKSIEMDYLQKKARGLKRISPNRSPNSLRSRLMCRYSSFLKNGGKEDNIEKDETVDKGEGGHDDKKCLEHCDSKTSVVSNSGSVNQSRIAALADLMTVFVDEDECSSDQDEMMNELQQIGYIVTPESLDNEDGNERFGDATRHKTQEISESVYAGTNKMSLHDAFPGKLHRATHGQVDEMDLFNYSTESTYPKTTVSAININVCDPNMESFHKEERDKSSSDIYSLTSSASNMSFTTCTNGDLELVDALTPVSQTPGMDKVIRRALENEETALTTRRMENKKDMLYLEVPVPKRTISAGIIDLIESRKRSNSRASSAEYNIQTKPLGVQGGLVTGRNDSSESDIETSAETWKFKKYLKSRPKLSKRTGLYDAGVIELTLQYLIITERLKVTILHVCDLVNFSSSFSSNMFVQVSLMPCKMQKQTSKSVKSSMNPDFSNVTFYFSGISLSDMHLMTVRVQIMQRKRLFQFPKCIAEMYVALDNIDLVGETVLKECLRI